VDLLRSGHLHRVVELPEEAQRKLMFLLATKLRLAQPRGDRKLTRRRVIGARVGNSGDGVDTEHFNRALAQ